MKESPIERLLNDLLTGEEAIEVQIAFTPGLQVSSGALKRGPVAGTYCLGTLSQATEHTPGDYKPGDFVMIEQIFDASAVQRVMRAVPTSGLITPGASDLGGH